MRLILNVGLATPRSILSAHVHLDYAFHPAQLINVGARATPTHSETDNRSEERSKERSEERLKERSEERLKERSEERLKERSEERLKERSEERLKERSEERLKERSEERLKEQSEVLSHFIYFCCIWRSIISTCSFMCTLFLLHQSSSP